MEYYKIKEELQFFDVGRDIFHVYDPITNRHFKIGKQEVTWLKLLDGKNSKEYLKKFIPEEVLDQFLLNAEKLGLLENENKRYKLKLNILKIKFRILNPNKILNKMSNFSIYYRKFLNLSSIPFLIFNILFITYNFNDLLLYLSNAHLTFNFIYFYLVIMLLNGFFHEFSHALVAKSYGVNVVSMGIMLLYFQPTFYTDITGINFLNKKNERINVLIAGVMANNILVAIALTIFHYIKHIFQGASLYILYFAIINCLLIITNLIPFIEFDGYYILSNLFEEGDIKTNVNYYIRNFLEGKVSKNLRLEYVFYFVLSKLFTISILILALLVMRRYVITIIDASYILYANYIFLAMLIGIFIYYNSKEVLGGKYIE
ncbi:M50 family metallopeptidase [Thermoanaerobacter pentosaceus]|uniref:Peptide zinc metalloprotease protein n=1 Tax=Thermoanaerobacter pentosaceus TaxID=694059 RepID=A0ABT9M693_9THEO|nr:M50 family metallopeptidase [Thermoanaerobacter pentosaceus]MDP9751647.1 putative peptide zinc metalloprotease protein [Thermoanaerobacter pentosaceus]